ncbi:MAG: hypothetical protein JXA57_04375 [Armatimonadetes bacterium]|nr:hypothetical protein [Armatimonadota bacterium]
MAVISGYHVDDYCVEAFRRVLSTLTERFSAEKVMAFADISPGDLIARIPPKIISEGAAKVLKPVPVYLVKQLGTDFDEDGQLIRTEEPSFLYFEASACYDFDLNGEEPVVTESAESCEGAINCFDGREIGQVKEKHQDLEEDLKGILYRIPADRLQFP